MRAAWRAGMAGIDPSRFVFLEETSTPLSLTPRRARAPRGQRAVGRVPHGPDISWLATLTSTGIGESLVVPGAVDRQVFDLFVARVLVPNLRPGQIVILDNLKVHESATARRHIAAAGCHLLFLPTYSPDMNPIEHAFAKRKQALRRWSALVGRRRRRDRPGARHRHRSRRPRLLRRCRVPTPMTQLSHGALGVSFL